MAHSRLYYVVVWLCGAVVLVPFGYWIGGEGIGVYIEEGPLSGAMGLAVGWALAMYWMYRDDSQD